MPPCIAVAGLRTPLGDNSLVVSTVGLGGGVGPVVPGSVFLDAGRQFAQQRAVLRQGADALGHLFVAVDQHPVDGVFDEVGHTGAEPGQDGHPGFAGFQGGDAERLSSGGRDEHVGLAQDGADLGPGRADRAG